MSLWLTKTGLLSLLLGASLLPTTAWAKADEVRPPSADETLIYVIRRSKMLGGAIGYWIAVNDQTVARVRNGRHAVIRAAAGTITLNLALQGTTINPITLDDRHGQVVYLLFRVGNLSLTELSPEEGKRLLRKTKPQKPLDEVKPNNEHFQVIANLGQLGFDLMRPAANRLDPDPEHAVVSFFRRSDGEREQLGVWNDTEFLGSLAVNEGFDVRLPPGDHVFVSALSGTTTMRGRLEAGKRYYAWVDYGAMMRRVRLTPVPKSESKQLAQWTKKVRWVALDPDAVTGRVSDRVNVGLGYVREIAVRVRSGQVTPASLGADHAHESARASE